MSDTGSNMDNVDDLISSMADDLRAWMQQHPDPIMVGIHKIKILSMQQWVVVIAVGVVGGISYRCS